MTDDADNDKVLHLSGSRPDAGPAVLSPLGAVIGTESFPPTGHRQSLQWACTFGAVRRAGVEGSGSYGAALSHYPLAQHMTRRPDPWRSGHPASVRRRVRRAVVFPWLLP
ncbi:hypothetical protein T261_8393 [Streptomyces lydicus]|nr:hypothetical protein T261_8393 [Streptomyces lydicus]